MNMLAKIYQLIPKNIPQNLFNVQYHKSKCELLGTLSIDSSAILEYFPDLNQTSKKEIMVKRVIFHQTVLNQDENPDLLYIKDIAPRCNRMSSNYLVNSLHVCL
jgi:hypothetical protein